ncbi:MAG: tRNA preQ1(34) S-adenosylmethionine ribosyltransferase-isomerase QueA [Pseudomonadota bacterium]|nr:tRNA preQ1(34) S-adenosylmethionine ribosyltransferase-isomerase QueA [Pseudomonadota bacterium]
MKTGDFDFDLPPERIAAAPASPRDSARMLCLPAGQPLQDRHVRDLPALLCPDDLLVFNDTRVIPARLSGKRGEARVEVTLHRRLDERCWKAFARPAKRLKTGDTAVFADGFSAAVTDRDGGEVTLSFSCAGSDLVKALEQHGTMPLPPYIPRPQGPQKSDTADYQTVFSSREGAVAAPTAGLHFTPELLEKLAQKGIRTAPVTLHVGAGTFLPVKTEDVRDHVMHSEYGEVPAETARRVNETRARGGRIVAVGTTSLRILETAAGASGAVHPYAGETDIFILPGYGFRCVDVLMTNFHLPRSTLFMLVCAFAGTERIRELYAHAIRENFRFFSYGDACLLERSQP